MPKACCVCGKPATVTSDDKDYCGPDYADHCVKYRMVGTPVTFTVCPHCGDKGVPPDGQCLGCGEKTS